MNQISIVHKIKRIISLAVRRREPRMMDSLLSRALLIIGAALNLAMWTALLLRIQPQENPIFLHYNIYFGVDLIGPWYLLYAVPAMGLAVLAVNFLIARFLYRKHQLLGLFVLGGTVYLELLLFIAIILIVRQNIG